MLEKGNIIGDKYQVLEVIGYGGMSNVYLVMDLKLQKKWAMKEIVFGQNWNLQPVLMRSVLAEINVMKKLDHLMLPRIVDVVETSKAYYVIMDYVEGVTLSRYLRKEGTISQERAIQWAKELCGVLSYLHEQQPTIIYRDMKPSNIILQSNGSLKLIDFGTAKEYGIAEGAETIPLGTKGYAAPEQYDGTVDIRTDIYGLGMTLYQLLTGKKAKELEGEIPSIRAERPDLSLGLEYVIKKCTRKNPKERYQNCKELLYDLEHYEKLSREYWELGQRKQKQKKMIKRVISWLLLGISAFLLYKNQQEVEVFLLQLSDVLDFFLKEIHDFFNREWSTLNFLSF